MLLSGQARASAPLAQTKPTRQAPIPTKQAPVPANTNSAVLANKPTQAAPRPPGTTADKKKYSFLGGVAAGAAMAAVAPSKHGEKDKKAHTSKDKDKGKEREKEQASGGGGGHVFGVNFEVALQRSARVSPDLPDVMSYGLACIETQGLDEEGIFRVSGSVPEMNQVYSMLQSGQFPDMDLVRDVNVVASLLKRFFREMPEQMFAPRPDAPPVPAAGGANQVDYLRALLESLAAEKRKALYALFRLLVKINANRRENMMDSGNLAIVFSPTLGTSQAVVCGLIDHFDDVFAPEDAPRLPAEWPNIDRNSRCS